MKAVEITIHNFRSICDASITLAEYGILVGVNNAGKTTVIDAIRAFYGKGVKFDENRDFPHKGAEDNESWIEIEFKPSADEIETLKDEYRSENDTFRVRNYIFSDKKDKKEKSVPGHMPMLTAHYPKKDFTASKTSGRVNLVRSSIFRQSLRLTNTRN